jgi:hypothetical protein
MFYLEEDNASSAISPMEISSYPVKFSDDIVVEIKAEAEDHCIIVLTNHTGRIRRMMGVNLSQGTNDIHVDNVDTLEAGLYQLTVKNTEATLLYSSILTKSL